MQKIYPGLRYRDAVGMIAWLGQAFGFTEHFVVPGAEGTIAHAQLQFGSDMIMLGTHCDDDLGTKLPGEVGGVTQMLYLVVAEQDLDQLFDQAQRAGAEIIRAVRETDYRSREFTVRDPEGHLWSFGTYQPGQAETLDLSDTLPA